MDIAAICDKIISHTENIHDFLKPSKEVEERWITIVKCAFDFMKSEEKELEVSQPQNSLKSLFIKGVDVEQVFQQIELHNNIRLNNEVTSHTAGYDNLYYSIAKSCSSLHEEKLSPIGQLENESSESESYVDEGVGSEEESLVEDSEGDNDEVDEIDFDADTFEDLAREGEITDEEEEEEEEEEDLEVENVNNASDSLNMVDEEKIQEKSRKFKNSLVDTQFLNLRESEWVADNDILGKSFSSDDNSEAIDFMEDMDSGQSDHEIMYDNFFDPPVDIGVKASTKEKKIVERKDTSIESHDVQIEKIEEPSQTLSKFDQELQKEAALKESLMNENYILEKPWEQKGEATKDQRPENSALEEQLEYNIAASEKPIVTESISQEIEKIILGRIRTQTWDDVLRVQRPRIDPSKYKEKLILDEEKSKKDLSKIYEEEYVKKLEQAISKNKPGESSILAAKEIEEEPEVNKIIRSGLNKLFMQLDALANYHFTPKYKNAELKVVANLSAITLEESTPAAASDATLLAPQEIVAPVKGDVKGERERTSTDKKRERRAKKLHQKRRAHTQEQKLKAQIKNKGKNGLMNPDTSVKYVQNAIKKGQIKVMKHDNNQLKSSTSLFNHMEDCKKAKRKSEDHLEKTKKKQKTISSVSKIKL